MARIFDTSAVSAMNSAAGTSLKELLDVLFLPAQARGTAWLRHHAIHIIERLDGSCLNSCRDVLHYDEADMVSRNMPHSPKNGFGPPRKRPPSSHEQTRPHHALGL